MSAEEKAQGDLPEKSQGREAPPARPSPTEPTPKAQACVTGMALWQGPLPNPADLERYEKLLPGAFDRILKQFEQQTTHRQGLQDKALRYENARSWGGLIGGTVVVLTIAVDCIWLIANGYKVEGTFLATVDIASVLYAYRQFSNGSKKNGRWHP